MSGLIQLYNEEDREMQADRVARQDTLCLPAMTPKKYDALCELLGIEARDNVTSMTIHLAPNSFIWIEAEMLVPSKDSGWLKPNT